MHDRIVEMSRMPEKKSCNDWLSFEARAVKSVKDQWEFKDQSETVLRILYTLPKMILKMGLDYQCLHHVFHPNLHQMLLSCILELQYKPISTKYK